LNFPRLAGFVTLLFLCGCQAPQSPGPTGEHTQPSPPEKKSFDIATRNNALALLDQLLNEEKNLSKILIIKRESVDLNRLVKNISEEAGEGAKMLEALAKKDPDIKLAGTDLPRGEAATRKAISKTKEHTLLLSKGPEFQFQILLTQAEALNYGAHLALVAAENEPEPARAQDFSRLSAQLTQLLGQVLAMLRTGG
jgi:hypothetical protein